MDNYTKRHRQVMLGSGLAVFVLLAPAVAAQDFTWSGDLNNNWGSCSNWSPMGIPGVLFDCNGDSIQEDYQNTSVLIEAGDGMVRTGGLPGEFILGSLTVDGSIFAGQTRLLLEDALTLNGPGTFFDVQIASQFTANGSVLLFDGCSWINASTILGSGAVTVAGGTFTIGATNTGRFLDGITLTNDSQVTHFNPLTLLGGATIQNDGTWVLGNGNGVSNATLVLSPGETGVFNNPGTITTNLVDRTATINVPLMHSGLIEVNESTVTLGGGGLHSGGSYSVAEDAVLAFGATVAPTHVTGDVAASGAGTMQIARDFVIEDTGTLTLNMAGSEFLNFTGGLLGSTTSGATLTCEGLLTNNAKLWWTSMTIAGDGLLGNAEGAELFITEFGGQDYRELQAFALNEGLVVQDEDLILNGGLIQNNGTWILADGNITGTGEIDNAGLFEKPASASAGGNTTISAAFNMLDGGVLRCDRGIIILTGGGQAFDNSTMEPVSEGGETDEIHFEDSTYTVSKNASLKLNGDGVFEFDNMQLVIELAAGMLNDGPDVYFLDGAITGAGALFNDNGLVSLDGTLIGTTATVRNDDTMFLGGVTVDGRIENLNVDSKVFQEGFCTVGSSGSIDNLGLYEIKDDLSISGFFLNQNEFVKPVLGSTVVNVIGHFSNPGTVRVKSGTLRIGDQIDQIANGVLTGGTWIADPGALLDFGHTTEVIVTVVGEGATVVGSGAGLPTLELEENEGDVTLNDDFSTPGSFNNGGTVTVTNGTTSIDGTFTNVDEEGAILNLFGLGILDADEIDNGEPDIDPEESILNDVSHTFVPSLAARGAGSMGGFVCLNFNNYSNVLPGGRNAAGPFAVTGNFNQFETGTMEIDLNGTAPISGHDQLVVTDGDVNLAGTLDLTVLPSYAPAGGEQFTIITVTNGQISGQFDQITGGGAWSLEYNPDSVVLTLNTPPCTADAVADGTVNVLDLLKVLSDWGACPSGCDGDVNFDNVVDVLDLLLVLGHWGQCN